MVLNAREFNERGSRIYEDAGRLRRVVSKFMTKNNPAYKTPGYVVLPTPLPGEGIAEDHAEDEEGTGDVDSDEAQIEEDSEVEVPSKKRGHLPRSQTQRRSATPTLSETLKYSGASFTGLNFQQAQEKIVEDMLEYKEDPEFVYTIQCIQGLELKLLVGMTSLVLNPSLSYLHVV